MPAQQAAEIGAEFLLLLLLLGGQRRRDAAGGGRGGPVVAGGAVPLATLRRRQVNLLRRSAFVGRKVQNKNARVNIFVTIFILSLSFDRKVL